MNNTLVSIILPTYNWNHYWLSKAIDSVLYQSYKNFELIIINDASTNDIEKTILEYKEKDKRIIYIKNEYNLKLTKTLNKGIEISQGEYIARIDDDDIRYDKEKLATQVGFMETHKDIWLCGTCVININELWEETSRTDVPQNDQEIRSVLMRFNQFAHASVLFRKDIVNHIGWYDPLYNGAEDYEFRTRIWCSYKFANLPDYYLKYRHNTQWISTKKNWTQWRYGITIAYKYRNYYPWFWKYIIPRLFLVVLPRSITSTILQRIKR